MSGHDDDRPERRPEPPHAARFGFLLGALGALGVAALVFAALVVAGGGRAGDDGLSGWSPWEPSERRVPAGAEEIAAHVGPKYKLENGEQLVAVQGGEMEIAGLEMSIAQRTPAGGISISEGDGVLYRLCGLGQRCAIEKGRSSVRRMTLLRREALELALYSFRYLRGVDDVVVLLPPRKGQNPNQATHFRRQDLEPALDRPLQATLTPQVPSISRVDRSPDRALVDQLTGPNRCFSLTQANGDDSVFLVLEPLPEEGRKPCPGATAESLGG